MPVSIELKTADSERGRAGLSVRLSVSDRVTIDELALVEVPLDGSSITISKLRRVAGKFFWKSTARGETSVNQS